MPKKSSKKKSRRQPSYRLHKARDCAVVTIHGKNHYLGPYRSPESYEKYARLIAQWEAGDSLATKGLSDSEQHELSVSEVILRYLEHAEEYYKSYPNPHEGEMSNLRYALRPLRELYGRTLANAFSPEDLENVRRMMIKSGLARTTINGRITRIKRVYKWAASKRLVSSSTYHGLKTVDGLRRGRTSAKETDRVLPVPEPDIIATCEHLNKHVAAMVKVQELTGMRPQDIRNMRTRDIDTTQDIWVYEPFTHKNEHHGHPRLIAIGPRAQEILTPFLKPSKPEAFVFSPKDVLDEINKVRRANRKTPMTPSQRKRKRKPSPKRKPGLQYTKDSYRYAVARASEKANVPPWHPHQLRHNCATKVRKLYGIDGAVAVLGHKIGIVTEIYAEQDFQKAIDIMREIG